MHGVTDYSSAGFQCDTVFCIVEFFVDGHNQPLVAADGLGSEAEDQAGLRELIPEFPIVERYGGGVGIIEFHPLFTLRWFGKNLGDEQRYESGGGSDHDLSVTNGTELKLTD